MPDSATTWPVYNRKLWTCWNSLCWVVGVVVLGQLPSGWEFIGLVLVSVAVALASADGRAPRPVVR